MQLTFTDKRVVGVAKCLQLAGRLSLEFGNKSQSRAERHHVYNVILS